MTAKTTIYIDEALLSRVRRHVPVRGFSQLINELLTEHIDRLERAELEARMREGYQATRVERQGLQDDWQAVDDEGWPA